MAIFNKKEDFSKHTKEELKKMREECIKKLNSSASEYSEPDRLASAMKDSGTFGLRTMSRPSNDRRFWQNRLNAIDSAIKEKDSPKAIAEQFKIAEAKEILKIEKDPLDSKAAEELQDIRLDRFAWLCEIAGYSKGKKLSEPELAVLEQLISSAEISMNHVAENYAKLLGVIESAAKNSRKPVPNYDRQTDDYSQLVALGEISVLNRIKELEFFKNRNEKGSFLGKSSKASKAPQKAIPKGMRRKDERLESLINTKDYGVGGLGE